MSRKDQLNALFGLTPHGAQTPAPEVKSRTPRAAGEKLGAPNFSPNPPAPPAPEGRIRAGAVGAMSASLAQIAAGERVVELDPNLVDPAPVTDRLTLASDPSLEALTASIRESGQQVPVLVRVHPRAPGRWQAAYGHRRISACRALGRPVKAVVRALTDEELALAQGQENTARRDLSFIEKALFAAALEDAGIERHAIMAALSTEKSDLSRYIAVARAVPRELAAAIGPAPKAGRARWLALAEALERAGWRPAPHAKLPGRIDALTQTQRFADADSDARFAQALAALTPKLPRAGRLQEPPLIVTDEGGREIARLERGEGKALVTVRESDAPGFAAFLAHEIPALHRRWREGAGEA